MRAQLPGFAVQSATHEPPTPAGVMRRPFPRSALRPQREYVLLAVQPEYSIELVETGPHGSCPLRLKLYQRMGSCSEQSSSAALVDGPLERDARCVQLEIGRADSTIDIDHKLTPTQWERASKNRHAHRMQVESCPTVCRVDCIRVAVLVVG